MPQRSHCFWPFRWPLMARFLERPRRRAPWYNATGTSLYVMGMLVSAFALQPAIEVMGKG